MNISLLSWLILLAVIYLVYIVAKIDERVKGLQYRLQRIEKQIGVEDTDIEEEVARLLAEDKDVQAVKYVREILGLSLVEAKQYVDKVKAIKA